MFDAFNSSLPKKEADAIGDLMKNRGGELLAARSEDARIRLAVEYIEEVNEILGRSKGN